MKLSLAIPTYNEKENVENLVEKIHSHFKEHKIDGELIIVDDNSPDGTGQILEKLKKKYSFLSVIHRAGKLGLSSAVLDGWKIAKGDVLGVMDADLSHPVEKLSEMFNIIKNGEADFVVGSRYTKGGNIEGWTLYRKLMSRGATLLARFFTSVKDPMSGFLMIKKECLNGVKLNAKGFKILLELIVRTKYKKIKEVPITFINRTAGKSKAGTKEIIYYIRNLSGYMLESQFLKFALVGAIGTIINIAVLYALTEFLGVYYLVSAFFAFCAAVINNFLLNKVFTFKETMSESFLPKFLKFFSVSVVALAVNLVFLYIFTDIAGIYYIVSQIMAIIISLSVNFFGNKIWTFKRSH